jgi:hypothetical protein
LHQEVLQVVAQAQVVNVTHGHQQPLLLDHLQLQIVVVEEVGEENAVQ